jgi:hypothetical protein
MKKMQYCVQCLDITTNTTGSFGYEKTEQGLKALTPVFSNVADLFTWFRANNIEYYFN